MCFGFFDPENTFSIKKLNNFRADPTDISAKIEPLVLQQGKQFTSLPDLEEHTQARNQTLVQSREHTISEKHMMPDIINSRVDPAKDRAS